MDQMGQTDGVGLIIYSGSRDELQAKLRARDDRISELEAALRECMNYIYDEGAEPDGIRMAHVLQNTKP